jgi:hypothetical protein
MVILAGCTWLTLAPLGGDVRMVAAWLETIRLIPPGSALGVESPVRLAHDVVLSAFWLGWQVAAPLVAMTFLLQSLWSALARASGGAWQPALSPLRSLLCLGVLGLTSLDLQERLAGAFSSYFDAAVQTLDQAPGGSRE